MKKLTTILLLIPLFLTSCSIDWNGEKDMKIAELEKKLQDDTFKKNQDCFNYQPTIVKEREKFGQTLKQIFYSPIKKSCLYEIEYLLNKKTSRRVVNLFTGEQIIDCNDCDDAGNILNKWYKDSLGKLK